MNTPRIEDFKGMLLAGLRRHHAFDTAHQTIPRQWADLHGSRPSWRNTAPGISYGAVCGATDSNMEYLCGYEVDHFDALTSEWGRMIVPAQRYAVFTHDGPIAGIQSSWQQAMQWVAQSADWADAPRPPFERYDTRYDPISASGPVEIWLPIQARSN